MPKVSIIVPVYNVERYLRKCLDSLVNQSLSSIEIIIVNDGSTDGSEQIIKEFASSYTNIIHITQNNMGLSEARNTGVRYATGDYIAFLDSDDWVVNDAYKILYEKAIKNNDDIVCCGFYMAYDDSDKLKKYSSSKEYISVAPREKTKIFKDVKVAAWDKIYRRTFFIESNAVYPSGLWYEDTAVSVPLLLKASKVSVIKEPLVYYRQRPGSITKQALFNTKIFDVYNVYEQVVLQTLPLKKDLPNVYNYYFVKKCLIDNIIRLNRYNCIHKYATRLKKEYYARYKLSDIITNELLTIKEKVSAYSFLLLPSRVFSFIINKALKS
jgi:glycosyltransferase involved in cell wall biosynthesis